MRVFVTGIDTGVGKTYATALLARALRSAGRDPLVLKPVCSGGREDAVLLQQASGTSLSLDDINPWHFEAPVAPAFANPGPPMVLGDLVDWYDRVTNGRDTVLVEGVGGWLVPAAPDWTMADFAVAIGLPVIIVVANRLGCINHTLLTLESIRARGLVCAGLILNTRHETADASLTLNRAALEAHVRVLCEISPGQTEWDSFHV